MIKTPCSYLATFVQAFSECIKEYSYSKSVERSGFYYTTLNITYIVNGIKKYYNYLFYIFFRIEKFVGKASNKQISKHLSSTIGLLTLLPFLCEIAMERSPDRHKPYGKPKIINDEVKHDEPLFGKEIVRNHPRIYIHYSQFINVLIFRMRY